MYGVHVICDPTVRKTKDLNSTIDPNKGRYPLSKILSGKCPNFPIHRLKDKLIRSGTKKTECEQCGYSERRITDGKIPLLLNFEDGNKTMMPLSLTGHHALIDGKNMGDFFNTFQEQIEL